jgi:hypothetical protein
MSLFISVQLRLRILRCLLIQGQAPEQKTEHVDAAVTLAAGDLLARIEALRVKREASCR